MFFALIVGHAIADFALQGEFLSIAKNRHASLDRFFGKSPAPKGVWVHALTAHALIHVAPVWLITGSVALGVVELVLHWLIDFAKCEGWTSFTVDQLLHLVCKALYVGLLLGGMSLP
ncbi:hypothetical protein Hsar01_03017 [Haloferula sargassicola]|uniref:DUF3307 domain-containing protein n=2 Tax=Haloferula sargassicola TaxID=490096 RepID=A0ABP9UV94_9BACT